MTKICKCRHEEKRHIEDMGCNICQCKKFEEETFCQRTKRANLKARAKKPQKGCGKVFDHETIGDFMCGAYDRDEKLHLCPDCKKPQNHSPSYKTFS